MWRFGLGDYEGGGYQLSRTSRLLFLHSSHLAWSYATVNSPLGIDSSIYRNTLYLYDNALRFGNAFSASIRYDVVDNVGITFAYDAQNIYPRHLFWQWAGSKIIESIADGLTSSIRELVLHNSPPASPIVNFILKNGISYAFYELRKKSMNYPFTSAPSLSVDSFRIGLTFVF